MDNIIGLDFETYSFTDLIVHGLDNYTHDEYFTPLIACTHGPVAGHRQRFDFIADYNGARSALIKALGDNAIAAHNAGFEQAVLEQMGINVPSNRFVDTAVLARAAGAAGKLEAAAPQLLGSNKIDTGKELIKLFSIPGEYQARVMNGAFDPQIVKDYPDKWEEFFYYCQVDADLSYELVVQLLPGFPVKELVNNAVTMDMNNTGWHVDLDLVKEMQRRYVENVSTVVTDFILSCNAYDLNLSSFKQLQEWCAERGVKASSFDEASVTRMLKSVTKKIADPDTPDEKAAALTQVQMLLETKQVLGGSSLKKLQTLLDRTSADSRLRDNYLHIGAAATYRTSGRGVQMQNLKRLNGQGDDVELLYDPEVIWDNDRLASNLRQVFTATDPDGKLIVGDFSSVESRMLAWQAGEQWKLDAYHQGQDLYKVLAGKIFNIPVDQVTKGQRQTGKVGELACGYGAGPDAVREFAAKMGVPLEPLEATMLVKDWRAANQRIVNYWHELDAALHAAVMGEITEVALPHGVVQFVPCGAPYSLREQLDNHDLSSLNMRVFPHWSNKVLSRTIHGVYLKGRNVGYWKPSERKTGDLWVDRFTNPKTKQQQLYTVYGGKLSGLLTQSLAREMFFDSLRTFKDWSDRHDNVRLVGQFHDEIVVDWGPAPGKPDLLDTMYQLEKAMTTTVLPEFPLDAEIKSDYRYTK